MKSSQFHESTEIRNLEIDKIFLLLEVIVLFLETVLSRLFDSRRFFHTDYQRTVILLTKRKVLILTFLTESSIIDETMSGALFYLWLKLFLYIVNL
jgi:hypothetical protein